MSSQSSSSSSPIPTIVVHPSVPAPGVWEITKQAATSQGRKLILIFLITTKAQCVAEKAAVIPKIVKLRCEADPSGSFIVIASGDDVASAARYLGASAKDASLIVVSPHAKDRKKLAADIASTWGADISAMAANAEAYITFDVRHTCGRALGESCKDCPKAAFMTAV